MKSPDDREQADLFGRDDNLAAPQVPARAKLLPNRHPTGDFFTCDLFDYALKDDGASMEAPIFSLTTRKPDLTEWHWESEDGSRSLTVIPSIRGRATQFDKDVLIFVISQMTAGLNKKRPDSKNRTVRFTVHDYLVSTNKTTGGADYKRLELALDRLNGTQIKTDIKTGGVRVKEGFGVIDKWKIVERSPVNEQMIAIEITLSEWIYNSVQANEVLTINKDYFRLRKPLERRLYELARKHTGKQRKFVISLYLLKEKCGSTGELKEFKRMLIEIAEDQNLPDYILTVCKDQVTFAPRLGFSPTTSD